MSGFRLYRHTLTGKEQELLPEQAEVFGDVFELVDEGEGPEARRLRLLKEAADAKVDIDPDDDVALGLWSGNIEISAPEVVAVPNSDQLEQADSFAVGKKGNK